MRSQQIFVSSRNRDAGTPNDLALTFPNGLIKDENETRVSSISSKTTIELAEFSVYRSWYDVQPGLNDSFKVTRLRDQRTFTITIPPGWYAAGFYYVGAGAKLEEAVEDQLNAVEGGPWTVNIDDRTGRMEFRTPNGGYNFNFIDSKRTNDLLGFEKSNYPSTNNFITGSKPFVLARTPQLVMHTDIQPAFAQATIDNYSSKLFDNSDIMAVIPVNVPPRALINYQATDKINRICIKPDELRTFRIFFTDDQDIQIDMANCEWTAVFRVVYGDNLSV